MFILKLKRNSLIVQKQLNSLLRLFMSERGVWSEKSKDINLMLSSKENRFRMRCKLVEYPYFDTHSEASRLRDYSGKGDEMNEYYVKSIKI